MPLSFLIATPVLSLLFGLAEVRTLGRQNRERRQAPSSLGRSASRSVPGRINRQEQTTEDGSAIGIYPSAGLTP